MIASRRWRNGVLGALALVIAIVALGVILEHTVGPSWAAARGHPHHTVSQGRGRTDPPAKRIPANVRRELLAGKRPGARYGGSSFSNLRALRKAVVVQLGIGAIVIVLMLAWRRMRPHRKRDVTASTFKI